MYTGCMDNASLNTTAAVIDALGGTGNVARLTGRSYRNVWNWRKANRFSHHTFLKITGALKTRGLVADPALWGVEQVEPAE